MLVSLLLNSHAGRLVAAIVMNMTWNSVQMESGDSCSFKPTGAIYKKKTLFIYCVDIYITLYVDRVYSIQHVF